MGKYVDVSDETLKMFQEKFEATQLQYVLKMKVLAVASQKDLIVPTKASGIVQHLNGIDLFFFINEEVFDGLEEVSKHLLIEEAMARVNFDEEKEKLTINKGDIHTPSLYLQKHGLNAYLAAIQNIAQVIEGMKQDKKA